ncbi:MAG: permease-like cell division protein FtsX [Pseudomonadales bacterium]|nr:permease-like cell division protein FtsX [Pseudomonadales bacterium]
MTVAEMLFKKNKDRRKVPPQKLPTHLERRFNEGGATQKEISLTDRFRGYLNNHREVALLSLKRLLDTPLSSAMTWAVIAIALALPVGLFLFLQNAEQLSVGWERAVQISVYLKGDITDEQGRQLSEKLKQHQSVMKIKYIASDQALDEFRELSGFGDALQYLNENPLPAVIVVFPKTESNALLSTKSLVSELEMMPEVDQAKLDLQWVERLLGIMMLGQQAAFMIGLLLSLAVLLVIGNTIRLAIEARRAEIVVIKLVGGTNAFVRRPFLYTGVWFGVGGGVLAWVLISLVMYWLHKPVAEVVAAYGSSFQLTGLGVIQTLALLGISAILGWLGAWVAVGRHLSDIEPR